MIGRCVVLAAIILTIAACGSGKKSLPEVHRVDSLHGYGYPYTFERARELRRAEMFLPAAYIYVHLYPIDPDSVIKEIWRMNGEAYQVDTARLAPYYIRQSIGREIIFDDEIMKQGPIPEGGTKINKDSLAKLNTSAARLLDDLEAYGLR
jgi:hypothetical protein